MVKLSPLSWHTTLTQEPMDMFLIDSSLVYDPRISSSIAWQEEKV
jgi:hypothetical protein